jgi:integrase
MDRPDDPADSPSVRGSRLQKPFPQLHTGRARRRSSARSFAGAFGRSPRDNAKGRAFREDHSEYHRRIVESHVRDAAQDGIATGFPFAKVRWPQKIVPGPSPFTEEERDRILAYFKAKRWKVGGFNDNRPHYPYFAFLYTLFFTGMRPSEAVAVRTSCVNLSARTIQVERSRHLGAEAPPKTSGSRRAIRLTRRNVEVLRPLIEPKAQPEEYLFKNVRGEPIDAANFYDLFRSA